MLSQKYLHHEQILAEIIAERNAQVRILLAEYEAQVKKSAETVAELQALNMKCEARGKRIAELEEQLKTKEAATNDD